MPGTVIRDIVKAISAGRSFFLTSHINPDGDSISCETAMALFLEQLGKKNYLIANRDGCPALYRFLPRAGKIVKTDRVQGIFDIALILDASDIQRTGNIIDLPVQAKKVIVIDHHLSAIPFGDLNYLDKNSASCAEQIYNVIRAKSKKITRDMAICLYTGLVTETNKFQEANTNPDALKTAALLVAAGVDPCELGRKLYEENNLPQLKLLGTSLSGIEVSHKGQVAYAVVTKQVFRQTGATEEDSEGIIRHVRSLKGVKVAIVFREQNNGFKVSMRSKGHVDVNAIAVEFGGGGHKKAAGFFLEGSLDKVRKKVFSQVSKQLA
ncbi:MAG: bifunctional oligoribonuclease/PAP phosphatase NrnA [bacterium]|nr:bifunctional oligoribonuclease/PAP phosphatase NrnA [bacterium]MDD5354396.1 bifunctional oligoribonuclease/PAP phosphatase NrnA [bacterium]MDD5757003.1 bifunctional oligoribonuclease/PAP phosphatase NrnA [bacterium]